MKNINNTQNDSCKCVFSVTTIKSFSIEIKKLKNDDLFML